MGNYISYKDILTQIDINDGDIVTVSSDILQLFLSCRENNEKFNVNTFIDTILEKIGENGTLLIPTYNWGFCKGELFDYTNTSSQVGGLGNVALKRNDFKRTKHPIYSFAVSGYDKNYLCGLDNVSGWGTDSPFSYLYERGAKNLFIGLDYKDGLTFQHYIEEKVQVDYRFVKWFTAPYVDEGGRLEEKTYSMYVRDLELNVKTAISPLMDDILLKEGCYIKYSINNIHYSLLTDLHRVGNLAEYDFKTKGGLIIPYERDAKV